MIREIQCSEITENIRDMCIEVVYFFFEDMKCV